MDLLPSVAELVILAVASQKVSLVDAAVLSGVCVTTPKLRKYSKLPLLLLIGKGSVHFYKHGANVVRSFALKHLYSTGPAQLGTTKDSKGNVIPNTDGYKKAARKIAADVLPTVSQFDILSNPHSEAAQARRVASRCVDDMCHAIKGKLELDYHPRFDIQISPREQRSEESGGGRGERHIHTSQDLFFNVVLDEPREFDLISWIDVIDYLEVSELQRFAGHPMAIYHIEPEHVSWVQPGGFGHVEVDGTVTETFAGGATYNHSVWDLRHLRVMISTFASAYAYEITAIPVAPQRKLIFLSPACQLRVPRWLAERVFHLFRMKDMLCPQFRRLPPPSLVKVTTPSGRVLTYVLLLRYGSRSEPVVSMRRLGVDGIPPVILPLSVYSAFEVRACSDKDGHINLYDMRQILKDCGYEIKAVGGDLAIAAVISGGGDALPAFVNFTTEADRGEVPHGVSAGAYVVGQPLAPQRAAPVKTDAATALAVSLQAEKQMAVEPSDAILDLVVEFVGLAYEELGVLTKWTPEMVAKKQSKPSQKVKNARVLNAVTAIRSAIKISAFVKTEARSKLRGIYPVDAGNSFNASQYSMPLYEATKKFKWFMSGKSGDKIARGLCEFFRSFMGEIPESYDVEGMDGSFPEIGRILLATLVWVLFNDDGEAGLTIIAEAFAAISAGGVTFANFMSNMSGSPWTTLLNSYLMAFLQYAAWRRNGFGAKEAWLRIGPVSGDDGGVLGSLRETFDTVCTECGMKLKWEEKLMGFPNMTVFLNRLFFDPKVSVSSTPALERLLTTVNTAVGVQGGLAVRIAGWRASDPDQIDVMTILDAFERCTPGLIVPKPEDVKEVDIVFKISTGAWPFVKSDLPNVRRIAAFNLKIDVDAYTRWIDRVSKAANAKDLKLLYLQHIEPKELPKGTIPCTSKVKAVQEKVRKALAPGKAKSQKKKAPDKLDGSTAGPSGT